jgi:hypothetical protein
MADAGGLTPYGERAAAIAELTDELLAASGPVMRVRVQELLDLIDAYNRDGVQRLLALIRNWRGEIFLDAVARDDVAGTFVARYDPGDPHGGD